MPQPVKIKNILPPAALSQPSITGGCPAMKYAETIEGCKIGWRHRHSINPLYLHCKARPYYLGPQLHIKALCSKPVNL